MKRYQIVLWLSYFAKALAITYVGVGIYFLCTDLSISDIIEWSGIFDK